MEVACLMGGLHSIKYFCSYQLLIVAGYEPKIHLYNIHLNYKDRSDLGVLKGHRTSVTAIEVIEGTPMVLSADDGGNIKVWDIRNL